MTMLMSRTVGRADGPSANRWHVLVVMAVATIACDVETPRAQSAMGNTRDMIAATPARRILTEPELTIGVLDGEVELQFQRIRDVALGPDRIYVLDDLAHEIRTFDRSGAFVRSVGREGEGPGEFISPTNILIRDSTIVALDLELRRVTHFGNSEVSVHTIQGRAAFLNPEIVGSFADGSFILSDLRLPGVREGNEESGVITAVRYSSQGLLLDTMGVFKYRTMVRWGGSYADIKLFSSRGFIGSDPDAAWFLRGDSALIIRVAPSGDTLQSIEWEPLDREVTQADIDVFVASVMEWPLTEERKEKFREFVASVPAAEVAPVAEGFMVDVDGRVWVRETRRASNPSFTEWLVFDPTGSIRERVVVPDDDFRIYDADDSHVVTVSRDELGVERVHLHRIVGNR